MTKNKFHFMSDLHIEFAMPKPMLFKGENLILAGDITCLRALNPVMNDAGNRKLRDRTLTFFNTMLENFDRVFYLTGNHESYNFRIDLEKEYIAKYLPGVIHLDDSSYEIDDKTVIMGGTLWTNMNHENPIDMQAVARGMNDFKIIYEGDSDMLSVESAVRRHKKTMAFLTAELDRYADRNVVVATHHAPSIQGVNREHSSYLDAGYYSALENFIVDHPQIKFWVHGHTHIQKQYQIGDCTLYSNARGYEGYEHTANTFNADTFFYV